ncbi:class I SAM-dependent methyltransferase [Amycolatopsis balhimycina DSM 5908]|uniref:Class I SAM-dependent methyltransferase n=1 Tax=Amycolatopsis balhimycina DSM 5908 TaxID=1081091 RepID=A0A428WZ15_AMYBA|nr:class I SAM-dependent methyltransferase [Amycolatopsis balhimycina]RSM48306.1 class I SAM-dependent methyltransferase [Amycolatopsis balhimycina DSM 5908]
MGLRESFQAGLARQLGHPSGLRGRLVGAMLNRRNRTAVVKAVEALEPSGTETALDIGFGGGLGLELLLRRAAAVHAVDISATMLDHARGTFATEISAGRLHLHEGSMTALPLDDHAVDAIVSTNTIYFVLDLGAAFAEVARVLTPSGRFVLGIGDPDLMGRSKMLTDNGFHIRPLDELKAALSLAGLQVTRQERFAHSGLGFHLLVTAPK